MAKKNKKGFRIPKEIGGVKVPKEARRAGERLIEKASSPEGRQVLASGLAMAATAAAAIAARQTRDHDKAGKDHEKAAKTPTNAGDQGTTVDPARAINALGDAAGAFMANLFPRHK